MSRPVHMKEVLIERPGQSPKISYEPRMRAETKVRRLPTGEELWLTDFDAIHYEPVRMFVVHAQDAIFDDYNVMVRPAIEAIATEQKRLAPAWCAEGEEPMLLKLDGSVVLWTGGA